MGSGRLIGLKTKAEASMPLTIVVVAILIIAVVFVLIFLNVGKAAQAGKIGCVSPGVGKGFCVEKEELCNGVVNPVATGCPKMKPFCCIGEAADAGTVQTGTTTQPTLKGSVMLYCKCKLEDVYMVSGDKYNRIDAANLKIKKGESVLVQARGTDDVKWCKIKVAGQGKSGTCSKDSGPSLTVKFDKEGDFKIELDGYNMKGDTKTLSSSAANLKVE